MQLLRNELAQARERRARAEDSHAQAALDGVILAIDWAIEDGGRASPSLIASAIRAPAPPEKKAKPAAPVEEPVVEIEEPAEPAEAEEPALEPPKPARRSRRRR